MSVRRPDPDPSLEEPPVNSAPHGLRYTELKKRLANNALRLSEVPEEHFVSLPLPTRRWVGGAYASFASPARRQPGRPLELDPPDRWWAASARGGAIAVYALQTAVPYADVTGWNAV